MQREAARPPISHDERGTAARYGPVATGCAPQRPQSLPGESDAAELHETGGRAVACYDAPSRLQRSQGRAGETESPEASSTIGAAAWLDEASPPAPTLKRTEARTFWQSVSCHIGEALLARHVRGHGLEVDVPRVGVPRSLAARGPRGDTLVARVVMVVVVVQVVVVLVVVGERALRRVGEHREVVVVVVTTAMAAHAVGAAAARQVVTNRGALVENADGAILADAVGHFTRVHPKRELVGEELAQTSFLEAAGAASLGQDWVHLVVDADAAVARALGRLFGKPVVLVVVPQQVL